MNNPRINPLQTKNFDWKTPAELVGITAIVVSLIFLGLQLKQTQDIAVSEISASHHASRIELSISIADHSDVWSRGNSGEDLDHAQLVTYSSLLDGLSEQYRIQWRHNLLFGRETTVTREMDFAAFLHRNPGARKVWIALRDEHYASSRLLDADFESRLFSSLVVDALKKLDEQSN